MRKIKKEIKKEEVVEAECMWRQHEEDITVQWGKIFTKLCSTIIEKSEWNIGIKIQINLESLSSAMEK